MIRLAAAADVEALAELRLALWPDQPLAQRRAEAEERVARSDPRIETFVAVAQDEVAGFAEVSLRSDYVNGCETSPVAFLEGIFVRAGWRRRGFGRALVAAVEQWGREQGCAELASDALLDNNQSHRFHGGAGFEETVRVVYFRKPL